MKRVLILAILMAISSAATAGNDNANPCGNNGNNCGATGGTSNAAADANASANAFGAGFAFATGGDSIASIGDIRNTNSATAAGGNVLASGNSTNHNTNANTAFGGDGGSAVSIAEGGKGGAGGAANAAGGQGGAGGSGTATSGGNTLRGGDVNIHEADIPDDVTIRQAAPVYLSTPSPSATCVITGGAGVSGIIGSLTVNAGKVDEACRVYEAVRINQATDPDAAKRAMCTLEFWALANPKQCAGVPVLFELSRAAKKAAARR